MIVLVHGAFEPATWYGGPTESTVSLARALARRGVPVRVVTTNADGPEEVPVATGRWVRRGEVPVWYGVRSAGGVGSLEWLSVLRELGCAAQAVHVSLGFSPWALVLAALCRRSGVRLVLSTRGSVMPEAMRRGEARKRLFLRLLGSLLRSADAVVHTTSPAEARAVSEVMPGVRVATVPNGLEFPGAGPADDVVASRERRVLFLGRLHPHKRVETLVRAVGSLVGRVERLRLDVAGTGDPAYVAGLERLAHEAGAGAITRFLGHVGGEAKTRLLQGASCLCLPSASENFGMAVAEALRERVPCVVTEGAPWPELESEGCGYQTGSDVASVAEGLRKVLTLEPWAYLAAATRARALAERRSSWDALVPRMLDLYAGRDVGRAAGSHPG